MVVGSVFLQFCININKEWVQFLDDSIPQNLFSFKKGESEGYTVKSKEKDIQISNYPLEQSEFYYQQKQGSSSSNSKFEVEFQTNATVTGSTVP